MDGCAPTYRSEMGSKHKETAHRMCGALFWFRFAGAC
jgi:hypothetical protein